MVNRLQLLIAIFVVLAMWLAGCSDDTGQVDSSIIVSAATSLTNAYTELADAFTAANPEVAVRFNFGASSALAIQIREGADADVYASADEINMARLTNENLVAEAPVIFARNELVMVTKPGNPGGIRALADLVDAGVVSLCGAEVPCGRYAAQALAKAGVSLDESKVSRGQNAAATLAAVSEGDAVAGMVYVTDAHSAGDKVEMVTIPGEYNVVATYPIAVLAGSDNQALANAFVDYVISAEGQAILGRHGFLSAP